MRRVHLRDIVEHPHYLVSLVSAAIQVPPGDRD